MSKRPRLSGCEYKKQRVQRQGDNERLAQSMSAFLSRDVHPFTSSNSACAESDEQQPANASQPEAPPDADAIAVEFEVEQSVVPQNVVQVGLTSDASHSQSQSEVEDVDKNECGADSNCDLSDSEVFTDAGLWPMPMTDAVRTEIVTRGSAVIQNKSGPFATTVRASDKAKGCTRSLTTDWFYRHLDNGERVLRSWMVYSRAHECLYCFCCRLFAKDCEQGASSFVNTGFRTWWKLSPKIVDHESSPEHLSCFEKWKDLEIRLNRNATLDALHQQKVKAEISRWSEVLKRLLDAALFLAKQNLAFRGHRESLDGAANAGNFLELVKLIAKYDPVMREHLASVRLSAKPTTSYLSPEVQNEFITLMAKHVRTEIIKQVKVAKYFAVLFDSTPDISHTDLFTQILRYVKIEDGSVEVKESFVDFIALDAKDAESLTDVILSKITADDLDFQDCRGQGYDNAATMAGKHSGVQRRLVQVNRKAQFVPCSNHSLNLAGVHAAAASPNSVNFFGTLERLYAFFSASTHRWDILKAYVPKTVKRIVETRWSARHDAVFAIKSHYENVIDALEKLTEHNENADTRGDASTTLASISTFPFLCFLNLWGNILPEVDSIQNYLQTKGLDLGQAMRAVESLLKFLTDQRDCLVNNSLDTAMHTCASMDIPVVRRVRKKRRMDGETAADTGLSFQDEIKRDMYEILDRLSSEIQRRFEHLKSVNDKFAFLQLSNLLEPANDEVMETQINDLTALYDEINGDELKLEVRRLCRLLQLSAPGSASDQNSKFKALDVDNCSALTLLQWIVKWGFTEMLPNMTVALRIFLTMSISVASCERSFSKLKLVKTYLRSQMTDARLSGLAVLSIERELAEKLDFHDVIKDFATRKARKVHM